MEPDLRPDGGRAQQGPGQPSGAVWELEGPTITGPMMSKTVKGEDLLLPAGGRAAGPPYRVIIAKSGEKDKAAGESRNNRQNMGILPGFFFTF